LHFLELSELSLAIGDVCFLSLNFQVNFGGRTETYRPVVEALELFEGQRLAVLTDILCVRQVSNLRKLLFNGIRESEINGGGLNSLHLSLQFSGVLEEQLDIDGRCERVVAK